MDHIQQQARNAVKRTAQASGFLLLVVVGCIEIYDIERAQLLLLELSIILMLLPCTVFIVAAALRRQASRRIRDQKVTLSEHFTIDELARTHFLLVDQSDLLAEITPEQVETNKIHRRVPSAMRTASNAGIRVAIFSSDTQKASGQFIEQALGSEPVVLQETLLGRLKPKQLISMIEASAIVFSQLSSKYKNHVHTALHRHAVTITLNSGPHAVVRGKLWDVIKSVRIARQTTENFFAVYRTSLAIIPAMFTLVIVSLILVVAYDINPLISPLQIIGLVLVGLLPAWVMLGNDKSHVNLMKHPAATRDQLIVNRRDFGTILSLGVAAAVLAGANHAGFFVRQNLDPAFLASDTPLYIRATTLTTITLLSCMYVHLLCNRFESSTAMFTKHFLSNKNLLAAMAGSLTTLSLFMYAPALRSVLNLQPLGFVDWLSVFFAAGLFLAVRLTQRFLKKYSRHAVIQLHHEVHGKK